MSDTDEVIIKALYASVVEDEGTLYIGFAEGEDEDEPYVMFRREGEGPIWFEVSDESFGAEDAVSGITRTAKGIEIAIALDKTAEIGFAHSIAVRIPAHCESGEEAIEALRELYGDKFTG